MTIASNKQTFQWIKNTLGGISTCHKKVLQLTDHGIIKSRKPRNMKEQLELWRAAARNKKEDDYKEVSKKPLPHLHPLVTQLNKELHAAEKEMLEKKDKAENIRSPYQVVPKISFPHHAFAN